MAITSPDLAQPIRDAIINNAAVMGGIPQFAGSDNVYTRSPPPPQASYPQIIISPDLSNRDEGGLSYQHLRLMRQVTVYGLNDKPEKYVVVDETGRALRDLFHRNRKAIKVPGWSVVDIWAEGPIDAPTADDMMVGRLVTLYVQLCSAGNVI